MFAGLISTVVCVYLCLLFTSGFVVALYCFFGLLLAVFTR